MVPTGGRASSPEAVPCIVAPPRPAEESGEAVLKDCLPPAEDGLVRGEALLLAVFRQVGSPRHAKREERPPVPPSGASRLHAVERHPTSLKQVEGAD